MSGVKAKNISQKNMRRARRKLYTNIAFSQHQAISKFRVQTGPEYYEGKSFQANRCLEKSIAPVRKPHAHEFDQWEEPKIINTNQNLGTQRRDTVKLCENYGEICLDQSIGTSQPTIWVIVEGKDICRILSCMQGYHEHIMRLPWFSSNE